MSLLDSIPRQIREALSKGPQAVVQAARELADSDLGLLTLYLNYVEDAQIESGRALAIESGRVLAIECCNKSDTGVARACRAWLMAHSTEDLGISHTLLSYFHRELIETGIWPSYLVGLTFDFLRKALAHSEASVKAEVLSLLALATEQDLLGQIMHAKAAVPLATALQAEITPIAEDNEVQALGVVEEYLKGGRVPVAPTLDSRELQRIVLDLMDAVDRYTPMLSGLDPLVTFIRRRALLDDAGVRVAQDGRPLQTVRVKAQEAATRLVQALVSFGEAVVAAWRDPDFANVDAPDYGLQIAWAPAASVPIHLSYADDDARRVFEILARLVQGQEQGQNFEQIVKELSPNVAAAFLRLLQRLRQHKDSVEVVLTDPQSLDWQSTVSIGPDTFGQQSISSLMRQARAVARGQGVHVPKDQVPQANALRHVFQVVDAILNHGIVTPNDIDAIATQRQVNYYKQGARVLGFLDTDSQPTSRARTLIDLNYEQRLAVTAIYFEDSVVGRAWRTWAGVNRLSEIDPISAEDFLKECVSDLTGATPQRRASTLRAWYEELVSAR